MTRKQAQGFKVGDNFLAGNIAVEAGVSAAIFVDVAGVVHDVDRWKMVALAQSKIIGIVRRSHFDRAGAEVAADPFIEDDGEFRGPLKAAEASCRADAGSARPPDESPRLHRRAWFQDEW
jgi:hypothetical protein